MTRHLALQRLLVRMMFDPIFAEATLRDPEPELSRLGLGERERSWLQNADARAFRHDPQKRRRALFGLISELRASSAIALRETRRIALLDGLFASQQFHIAVQQGSSLAAAFAEFLLAANLTTPQLPDVIRIEAQLARSRRELEAAGGGDWRAPPIPDVLTHVARAPGVWAGHFSPDALSAIQCAERFLFEAGLVPALALARDAPDLVLPAPTSSPPIGLGFIPTQAGISLVELDEDLVRAITRADGPTPIADVGEALAKSLVEDEVLIACDNAIRS